MTGPGPATPIDGAPAPIDLMAIAREILTIVVDGCTARNVTLPKTRYVAPAATPAYDTDQVTVNIGTLTPGRPGGAAMTQEAGDTSQYASFTIAIVRNVPIGDGGNAPSTREAEAAAAIIAADVATLYDVLTTARWRNAFGEHVPVGIADVHTDGPQGAVGATVAAVYVAVF